MKPITVTCFCHYSCCLTYFRSLASSYFSKTVTPAYTAHYFSEINISQGSVATDLRCGEIFNNHLIPNFLLSATVKEL